MFVISLVVKNEFGVMQRVMGEFTRSKVNVEYIVVGRCELPGKCRMALSVVNEDDAKDVLAKLRNLQDIFEAELVPHSRQSAFAMMRTDDSVRMMSDDPEEMERIIDENRPERFIMTYSAL
jgi:acetolactate synthase-1/3 small subunit